MKKLFFITAWIPLLLGFELNTAKFFDLIEHTPEWMENQIQQELAPFKEGFSQADLDCAFNTVNDLVNVKILNNSVSFEYGTNIFRATRIPFFIRMLRTLTQHVTLPDMEFLFCTYDCFDNPVDLEKTFCPIFTICKGPSNSKAVLWPEMFNLPKKANVIKKMKSWIDRLPLDRRRPLAFWRGNDNAYYQDHWNWDYSSRAQLVLFGKQHPSLINAKYTDWLMIETRLGKIIDPSIHGKYFRPLSQLNYKYLLAVDGNTFPSSFFWQLGSGSVVLKSRSPYREWFYGGLEKGVHYVEFSSDCHDLLEIIEHLNQNEEDAENLTRNARQFAEKYLCLEGAVAYVYKLLMAYEKTTIKED